MANETPALRPPARWEHLRWHWLKGADHMSVLQWRNGKWWLWDSYHELTPEELAPHGWTYHGPCSPDAIAIDAADETQIECAAASIANARGGRRGVPTVSNILDMLKTTSAGKLYDEVMDDARAVLTALAAHGKGDGT